VAGWKAQKRRCKAFLSSGIAVFGLMCVLFMMMYLVLPLFARTSIELSAFCDGCDGRLDPPAHLKYSLPGGDTGILLAGDAQAAVVAMIGDAGPPYPSTVFLLNKGDGRILSRLTFTNDVISATIDDGVLYVYNDKILYTIDARTGQPE